MKKLIIAMHTSVDGFVAGPDGEMDWIHVDEEIFSYTGGLTEQSDTALYGRVTFQMMENYWPAAGKQPGATKHDIEHSNWYNNVSKIVLSRTMQQPQSGNIEVIGRNVAEEIIRRKQGDGKNILTFGSPSAAHSLMQENLIDEFWLFINPVLIGKGIPLFKARGSRVNLKLLTSHMFSSGVTALHYAVVRA
jgi:dihydrofolate reductase